MYAKSTITFFICLLISLASGNINQCLNQIESAKTTVLFLQITSSSGDIYDIFGALDDIFIEAQEVNEVCDNVSIDLNAQSIMEPVLDCERSLLQLRFLLQESNRGKSTIDVLQSLVSYFHAFQDSCLNDKKFKDTIVDDEVVMYEYESHEDALEDMLLTRNSMLTDKSGFLTESVEDSDVVN